VETILTEGGKMKKILKNMLENIRSRETTVVRKTVLPVAAATLTFAVTMTGCVKDELFNTPHPDKGAVVLDMDGLPGGDGYTVDIDGRTFEATGSTFTVPDLFEPGTHTVTVYNRPEGFSVEGLVARVAPLETAVRAADGLIHPLPGYLHSGTRQIEVTADDSLKVEMSVSQRVRDLLLELTVTEGDPERIASVRGTLSGIAGAFDLAAQQTTGEAVSTAVEFTRTRDRMTADARLLGVMGDRQTLAIDILFTDGRTQTTESDLTDYLKDFDSDMTETFRLTGDLNTPVEAGISATIDNWQPGNGSGEDADIQ
jgi:hypothetical protein